MTTRKPGRPRLHTGGGDRTTLYLPKAVLAFIAAEAIRRGVPASQVVAEAISEKMQKSAELSA
jgi:hypothetical protein